MLGKEGIRPALLVTSTAMSPLPTTAAQNASQPHPHQAVNSVERIAMAVFEVLKPASRRAIHVGDDYLQTLPVGAFRLGSNRVFELLQTLSPRPSLPSLEVVSQKVEAPGWVASTIRVFSGCSVRPACRPLLHHLQRSLGCCFAPAQHHEVIRVPDHLDTLVGHQLVQRIEIDV